MEVRSLYKAVEGQEAFVHSTLFTMEGSHGGDLQTQMALLLTNVVVALARELVPMVTEWRMPSVQR